MMIRIIDKYEEDVITCDNSNDGGDGDDHYTHDSSNGHNKDHVSMKVSSQFHLLNSM